MRQNFWGKTSNQLENVKTSKKLICPWNHMKCFYDKIDKNYKYAKIFINKIKIDDFVLIQGDSEKVLIVKIKSDLKKEISSHLKIIRKNTIDKLEPIKSDNLIIKILNINNNLEHIKEYLNEKYLVENFYCYYRDCEIIVEISKSEISNLPFLSR